MSFKNWRKKVNSYLYTLLKKIPKIPKKISFLFISGIKYYSAYLVFLFIRRNFISRTIWLVGEGQGWTFNENPSFFFKYIKGNHPEIEIYFITREIKDPDDGSFIKYRSFKNYLYVFLSKILIFSHGKWDILIPFLSKRLSKEKILVHLQHGIIGFKKVKFDNNSFDLLVVSSEREKKFIVEDSKIEPEKIIVTGLPRYDNLKISNSKQSPVILFFPTWREWLIADNSNFTSSSYYKEIYNLLTDDYLIEILEKYNVKLNFLLHRNFLQYKKNFPVSKNISIIDPEADIQQQLKNGSLLITDYSSVSWDFYYLEKPVIFYQFDLDEYLEKRGAYYNMKTELFGDSTGSRKKLIHLIENNIIDNFIEDNKYKTMRKLLFSFRDTNCSERIYKEILKYEHR